MEVSSADGNKSNGKCTYGTLWLILVLALVHFQVGFFIFRHFHSHGESREFESEIFHSLGKLEVNGNHDQTDYLQKSQTFFARTPLRKKNHIAITECKKKVLCLQKSGFCFYYIKVPLSLAAKRSPSF